MQITIRTKPASTVLCLAMCVVSSVDAADDIPSFQEESFNEALVIELIEQLDSPVRAERVAAEEQLRELGPDALIYFPDSEKIESTAAREAVDRLRTELEEIAIVASLQPTMVRVEEVRTVGEWVTALSEQTGYPFEYGNPALAELEIPAASETTGEATCTFWQAVSDLEANVSVVVLRTESGGFLLEQRADESVRWAFDASGAIRVAMADLHEVDNLIDPERSVRLRTRLRVDVEPKLAGLFLYWNPDDLHGAVGEIELTPAGGNGRRELPVPTSQRVEFPVDFSVDKEVWLSRDADHPDATIVGSIQVKIAAAYREFAFRHLDEPGEVIRRRAGTVVTLESFEASRDPSGDAIWQAVLSVDYQSHPLELDSYQLWVFSKEISLRRQNGSVLLPSEDRLVSPAEGGAVRMSFRFDDPLRDLATATLIYEAPTAIMDVPVEFEIGSSE